MRLLQVLAEAPGAGKGLSTETTEGVDTGTGQTEAEQETRAMREIMIKLNLLPIRLTCCGVQINEILADFANHEESGDAGVLHLKLLSVSFQDMQADSFAGVELRTDLSFRNTKTASQTVEFVVPPEG